jgi:hypothetical protein
MCFYKNESALPVFFLNPFYEHVNRTQNIINSFVNTKIISDSTENSSNQKQIKSQILILSNAKTKLAKNE